MLTLVAMGSFQSGDMLLRAVRRDTMEYGEAAQTVPED